MRRGDGETVDAVGRACEPAASRPPHRPTRTCRPPPTVRARLRVTESEQRDFARTRPRARAMSRDLVGEREAAERLGAGAVDDEEVACPASTRRSTIEPHESFGRPVAARALEGERVARLVGDQSARRPATCAPDRTGRPRRRRRSARRRWPRRLWRRTCRRRSCPTQPAERHGVAAACRPARRRPRRPRSRRRSRPTSVNAPGAASSAPSAKTQ